MKKICEVPEELKVVEDQIDFEQKIVTLCLNKLETKAYVVTEQEIIVKDLSTMETLNACKGDFKGVKFILVNEAEDTILMSEWKQFYVAKNSDIFPNELDTSANAANKN